MNKQHSRITSWVIRYSPTNPESTSLKGVLEFAKRFGDLPLIETAATNGIRLSGMPVINTD
jgi:hypothetical protein